MQLRRVDAKDAVFGAVARSERVAVDRDDLRARPEGRHLDVTIALNQDHGDHDEHECDELAERLGKRAGRLPLAVGRLILAFGHA